MFRYPLLCFGFLLMAGTLSAQVSLSGTLTDELTQKPLPGAKVYSLLPDETLTDANGHFIIRHEKSARIRILFEFEGHTFEYASDILDRDQVDLGNIVFPSSPDQSPDAELPSITLQEDDDDADANISGLLSSGDDLFAKITDYTFSPARFDRRGLPSEYSEGYLNNLPVNDLESGGIYWNTWGGLNEVMREDVNVVGAEIPEWGMGGAASTFNTDLRASSQWKQTKVSYAVANRNYRNRIMATWSTGLLPSGWAISLSASRRWAQEGYIVGTFYDAYAYFASVEKRFNDHHSLNLVALGAPYKRGGSSTVVQEMYDLYGDHYYNAYWGFQQGEKRSSRVYSGHQPLFMLRHDFHINDKLDLTTSLGYQTGKSTVSAMDWLYANDPRPDYYRRLPSYVDDPVLADQIKTVLTDDKDLLQVQWDNFYQVNLNSHFIVEDADGIAGNTVEGALSHYIMEDRISDVSKASANIVLQYRINDNSQLNAGISATAQNTRNYKEVNDLMGGEFYIDWDKFADQDFPGNEDALQNDLRRPNRILNEGDQFGYDYYSRIRQEALWASYSVNLTKWEMGLAGSVKNHTYWRDGQTQNGKFPNNSYGESAKNNFLLPSGKALIRYKLDGRNYLTVSGMYAQMAPSFDNAYISVRTRDNTVTGLEVENISSLEARYDLKSPNLKASLAGFYISDQDAIESNSFYHDDLKTFVNLSLTGIDREYTGIEAAFEYKLMPSLTLQGAAAIGQYIYTSRPTATVTQDNDGSVLLQDITVYAKNLYVSGTPQSAYTAGLAYKSKKFWSLFLNVNLFQESWINFNPLRRTTEAVDLVEPGSDLWNEILSQEKIDPAWTVDISFYKSWRVNWPKQKTTFSLNIGITNLLDNVDYVNNGFEQYRFDYADKDVSAFPTKYGYMQGRNFFIQGSMKF